MKSNIQYSCLLIISTVLCTCLSTFTVAQEYAQIQSCYKPNHSIPVSTTPPNSRIYDPVADWMGANKNVLQNIALNRVVIPGTHNSGTYKLFHPAQKGWSPDAPGYKDFFATMGFPLYKPMAECQEKTIHEQLMDGVRAFDFRVCKNENGEFYACHSLYGAKVETMLRDIARFNTSHPDEIIILRFQHLYGMTDVHKNQLADHIKSILKVNKLIDTSYKPTSTLQSIWNDKQRRIIVLFDVSDKTNFWPTTSIKGSYNNLGNGGNAAPQGTWHKKANLKKTSAIVDSHEKLNPDYFFVLNCELTLDGTLIAASIDPTSTYPGTMKNLAAQSNPVYFNKIKNEWRNKKLNIIQVDYYNQTCILDLCKELNGIRNTPCIPPLVTNWGNWKLGIEILAEWAVQAGDEIINWADEFLNGPKVASPNQGKSIKNLPKGDRHYRITLQDITNLNSGSDGNGDIELYGSISVIPSENMLVSSYKNNKFYSNEDANQFLFNKRAGDRVVLKSNQVFRNYDGIVVGSLVKKDFYIAEKNASKAKINIVSRLMEHDDYDNDHVYENVYDLQKKTGIKVLDSAPTYQINLSSLPKGFSKEYKTVFKSDGDHELIQIRYTIARLK